jgi:hypothetical protein
LQLKTGEDLREDLVQYSNQHMQMERFYRAGMMGLLPSGAFHSSHIVYSDTVGHGKRRAAVDRHWSNRASIYIRHVFEWLQLTLLL